jgi:hypothetical protein
MVYRNDTGLPSVTDVVDAFVPAFIKKYWTDELRERGTQVHEALRLHVVGGWGPPICEDWQGYVDSGRRWLDQWFESAHLVEERLVDEERGFCGKPDLAMMAVDGRPMVVDWKTSASEMKTWKMQLAAYGHLVIRHDPKFATYGSLSIGALRLNKGGKIAQMYDYTALFTEALNDFAKALRATQHMAELSAQYGG